MISGGPYEKYNELVIQGALEEDPEQEAIVSLLDKLYGQLNASTGMMSRLKVLLRPSSKSAVQGLYIWGGVGRGKTMLMDMFCECLPEDQRLRLHFHRFMQRVHDDLKINSGATNPLDAVAQGLSLESKILCFDEFYVSDIGDAMILSELLTALFNRGVTLVATSNVQPDRLYWNGLQRSRFLPAINLLKKNTLVHELASSVDYRLRVLQQDQIYYYPLTDSAERGLRERFHDLAKKTSLVKDEIQVNGRKIKAVAVTADIAWFRFAELCQGPRSQNDYIELAKVFHTLLLSEIPIFTSANEDAARRFISLIDELYDCHVNLVLTAEVEADKLYQGDMFREEFSRTASRLIEMQSENYLVSEHHV